MNIILIDMQTRSLETSMCSVTGTHEGVVLRKGVDLDISDLEGKTLEWPVIVAGGYSAQSSDGFARFLAGSWIWPVEWVGSCGIGFPGYPEKGLSLRKFKRAVGGVLIPEGAVLRGLKTATNSNPMTADAVMAGLHLRVKYSSVILAEGQSDYVSAWEIDCGNCDFRQEIEFPEEHQKGIFPAPSDSEEAEN
jgi:hypothetical protein